MPHPATSAPHLPIRQNARGSVPPGVGALRRSALVVFTENLWEANNPTRAWELGQLAALQGLKRKAEQTLDRAGRHRTLGRQHERRHPLLVYRVFDCTDPL